MEMLLLKQAKIPVIIKSAPEINKTV